MGPLKNKQRSSVKTAHKYQDKQGRTRYQGTGQLRGTQLLDKNKNIQPCMPELISRNIPICTQALPGGLLQEDCGHAQAAPAERPPLDGEGLLD